MYKKLFWCFSFLCCVGALSYNAYTLVNSYCQYDVRVSMTVKNEKNMVFPAVTICNNNPFRKSRVGRNLSDLMNDFVQGLKNSPCFGNQPSPSSWLSSSVRTQNNLTPITKNTSSINYTSSPPTNSNYSHSTNSTSSTTPSGVKFSNQSTSSNFSTLPASHNLSSSSASFQTSATSAIKNISITTTSPTSSPSSIFFTASTGSTKANTADNTDFSTDDYGYGEAYTRPRCFPTSDNTGGGDATRSDFTLTDLMLEKLIMMDSSMRMWSGHMFYDMVYDCAYQGSQCDESNFVYLFNTYHGNCYTYNSVRLTGSKDSLKVASKAGSRYGLAIVFNVEQKEYIGSLSQSAGVRVVVHDSERMPFPEDDGILVSPGSLTHIGVTKVESKKLGLPYGNCRQNDKGAETMYQKLYNFSYCEKGCAYTCLNDEIIRSCNCSDIKFPSPNNSMTPCSSSDFNISQCTKSVWARYENGTLSCLSDCEVPCLETTYKMTISTETWPSENYKDDMKMNTFYDKLSQDLSSTKVSNYGKFVVYIQDFSYTSVSETPAYEPQQLSSDLGGVLGLFIGCSILSLVEFVELIIDIIFFGFCQTCTSDSCCRKKSSKKSSNGQSARWKTNRRIFPQASKSSRKSEVTKKESVEELSFEEELAVTSTPRMSSFGSPISKKRESKKMPVVQ